MELIPIKQLIKTAFGTAPIMALLFVTPLFLLTDEMHQYNFFLLWMALSGIICLAWFINLAFIVFVKKHWPKTWLRIIVVSSLMYIISFTVLFLINPQIKIERTKIEIIRLVNILAVNTIIFILTDLILTKENKNKFALENANLKLANLEAEYKLLKDQINPHFLFNALGTAKALIKKQPQLAEEYIVRLSDFLRASINNNKKIVSLKEELSLCNEFITLNKIRFGNALQYETNITSDIEVNFVPYFSILSLIENAIKHNSLTIETPLKITITTSENYLKIKNNKQTKFVMESSSKTGLKNINDRYKLLGAKEINIEETEKEYSVKLALLKK